MASRMIKKRMRSCKPGELTDRQRLFVSEYLADPEFNASSAAKKVGYKHPGQAAGKLLANPKVMSLIGKELRSRSEALKITAERVLLELGRIGFANPQEMFSKEGVLLDITEMPEEIARSISSIKVKTHTNDDGEMESATTEVRFWNKGQALELIAKHLGMMDERIHMEHEVGPDFLGALIKKVEESSNVVDSSSLTIEGKARKQ